MLKKLILKLTFSGFAAASLVACGGAQEFDPEMDIADDTANTSDEITLGPTCLTVAPDATMTIEQQQPSGYFFAHTNSNGTGYTAGACTSYVVDLSVTSAYSGSSGRFRISGAMQYEPTESNCAGIENRVRIYRKTKNLWTGTESSWELMTSENKVAYWSELVPDWPDHCEYVVSDQFTKPSLFTKHTYRVLAKPLRNDVAQSARVNWHWDY